MRKITILDTTLRDGEQAPGFSMNLSQKLEIAKLLEHMKVDIIEAGFPVASTEDYNAVKTIAKEVTNSRISAFSRAIPHDITRAYEAVKYSLAPRIHIFLATSDIHLKYKLKLTREAMVEQAVMAVKFAKNLCFDIQFTAEDATRTDPDFLLHVFTKLAEAGATTVTIADTVGYTTPAEIASLVKHCGQNIPPEQIGVHCHNDLGMATANALSAVMAGACQVDCSINGIGERAGLTALEEFSMALRIRREYMQADTGIVSKEIYRASTLVANSVGIKIAPNKPIVGKNAFAHEAGIHQHGMLANPATYEIISPQTVGVPERPLVLGKHSGKAALAAKLESLGHKITESHLADIFLRYKKMAAAKANVSDEDIEALIYGFVATNPYYSLVRFHVTAGTGEESTALICLAHDNTETEKSAQGETVVIAAFNAIDSIIQHSYPLHHFTIQSISEGRQELGESSVKIWYKDSIITGRGIDTDIVQACIKAYLNAINKALSME